jgi:hypothetical protein
MMRLRGSRCVATHEPDTPLRFEAAPGTIAAHHGYTAVILESTVGSEVRERDIATGMKQDVPVSDLNSITVSLSRNDIQDRWERVRSSTRDADALLRE